MLPQRDIGKESNELAIVTAEPGMHVDFRVDEQPPRQALCVSMTVCGLHQQAVTVLLPGKEED